MKALLARLRCREPLLFLFLFLVMMESPAAGELMLQPAERGWRAPSDLFRIRIPEDWPVQVLQRLALELDGVDITRMLVREGPYVVYRPVEPLKPGEHELRVVEYLPDGGVEERAVWMVEVRQSRAFRELDGSVKGDLTGAFKIGASSGWDDRLPDWSADGSLALGARAAEGEWRAQGRVKLGYHNKGTGSAAGRRLELVDYLLRLERGGLGVTSGHFSPLPKSLVSAGTSYRGMGVDFGEIDRRRFRMALFATRADSESGFQHGLGVTDPDNRVAGGRFTFFPLVDKPERLVLQGLVYDGTASTGGEGTYGGEGLETGNGFSLSANSHLLDGRLQLRAEYARTRWDADGSGGLASSESDDVLLLGMRFSGRLNEQSRMPLVWSLLLSYGRVGPYFYSLMNPGLQNDQEAARITLGASMGGWKGGLTLQRTENNVEDLAGFPTSRLDAFSAALSYRFTKPWGGVLETLGLEFDHSRGKPVSVPAGYPYPLADDRNRELAGRAGFLVLGGRGSLQLGRSWRDDWSGTGSDSRTDSWRLNYSRGFFGNHLNFRPDLSRQVTRDQDTGTRRVTENYQLPVTVTGLLDRRLAFGFTPVLNRTRSDADSTNTETRTLSAWATWMLLEQRANRPSVTLSLSGMRQEVDTAGGVGDYREWQLYAGIRIGYGDGKQ